MNPGLAFDRHELVMPRQVSTGIPRTGSEVPIAAEKKTTIFIGSVVGLQECLDPLPQLGIAQAFAIQDCVAVREVMVVCSLQENSLRPPDLWDIDAAPSSGFRLRRRAVKR